MPRLLECDGCRVRGEELPGPSASGLLTMTATAPAPTRPYPAHPAPAKGSRLLGLLRTTDHKVIGQLYVVTAFGFFMAAGAMAMFMRAELARPGLQFLSQEQYNQLFTIHGTIMLLLYATPIAFGFANLVLPLQIGSPDVASAAERLLILVVPFRWAHAAQRIPHAGRGGRFQLDGLHTAVERHLLAGARLGPPDCWRSPFSLRRCWVWPPTGTSARTCSTRPTVA